MEQRLGTLNQTKNKMGRGGEGRKGYLKTKFGLV